jgi:hypothetical protein
MARKPKTFTRFEIIVPVAKAYLRDMQRHDKDRRQPPEVIKMVTDVMANFLHFAAGYEEFLKWEASQRRRRKKR